MDRKGLRSTIIFYNLLFRTCAWLTDVKIAPTVEKPVQKKLRRFWREPVQSGLSFICPLSPRLKPNCYSLQKKPLTTLVSWLGPCLLGILCTASCNWPCNQLRIQDTPMDLLASNVGKWDKEEVWWRQGWQEIRLSEVLSRCFPKTNTSIIHQSILQEHQDTTRRKKPKV